MLFCNYFSCVYISFINAKTKALGYVMATHTEHINTADLNWLAPVERAHPRSLAVSALYREEMQLVVVTVT